MSSGVLRLPSSATVVPLTFAPGFSSLIGILTSGVQVYAASRWASPPIVYGVNDRMGEFVSMRPCEPWKISTDAPLTSSVNGNGITRNCDENSSFDRPATYTLPSTYARPVSTSDRDRTLVAGFGSAAFAHLTSLSGTSANSPWRLSLMMTPGACGPRPRATEKKTLPDAGLTTASLMSTSVAAVPSRPASRSSTLAILYA